MIGDQVRGCLLRSGHCHLEVVRCLFNVSDNWYLQVNNWTREKIWKVSAEGLYGGLILRYIA